MHRRAHHQALHAGTCRAGIFAGQPICASTHAGCYVSTVAQPPGALALMLEPCRTPYQGWTLHSARLFVPAQLPSAGHSLVIGTGLDCTHGLLHLRDLQFAYSFLCLQQGGPTQRTFSGNGANQDVIVASARAYISALNKLISFMSASQRAMQNVTLSQDEIENSELAAMV